MLLAELERALGYTKLRDRYRHRRARSSSSFSHEEAWWSKIQTNLRKSGPPTPDDDYLIALASISRSLLVSGDADLHGLADQIPVYSPVEFLAMIEAPDSNRT